MSERLITPVDLYDSCAGLLRADETSMKEDLDDVTLHHYGQIPGNDGVRISDYHSQFANQPPGIDAQDRKMALTGRRGIIEATHIALQNFSETGHAWRQIGDTYTLFIPRHVRPGTILEVVARSVLNEEELRSGDSPVVMRHLRQGGIDLVDQPAQDPYLSALHKYAVDLLH